MGLFLGDSEPSKIFVGDTQISKVFLGDTQVRPSGWQPGANTLLYLPLNSTDTYTDQSGNNVQTTNNGVAFGTYQGVDSGYFFDNHIQVDTLFPIPSNFTFLCWCYNIGGGGEWNGQILDTGNGSTRISMNYAFGHNGQGIAGYIVVDFAGKELSDVRTYPNQWVLFCVTMDGTTATKYLLGNNIDLSQSVSWSHSSFTPTYTNIGNEWNNGAPRYYRGGMSELILENKVRTAQEIADYYNITKSNYGIS